MSNLRESCSRAASIYKIMLHGLYGYINVRRSELVKSLVLYTIEEKRDFFLATLMYQWGQVWIVFQMLQKISPM